MSWDNCTSQNVLHFVPAPAFATALQRLRLVFEKLRLDNLKLNAGKCHFFCRQLRYCGHIISEKGVSTDPKKNTKVERLATSTEFC